MATKKLKSNKKEKWCSGCSQFKDLEKDFYNNSFTQDGKSSSCKVCCKNLTKSYYLRKSSYVIQRSILYRELKEGIITVTKYERKKKQLKKEFKIKEINRTQKLFIERFI